MKSQTKRAYTPVPVQAGTRTPRVRARVRMRVGVVGRRVGRVVPVQAPPDRDIVVVEMPICQQGKWSAKNAGKINVLREGKGNGGNGGNLAKRRQTQTRAGAASTLIGSCSCVGAVARFVGLIGWRAESPGALCGIVVACPSHFHLSSCGDGGRARREREGGWRHVREPCENGGFPDRRPRRAFPLFFPHSHTARGVTDGKARFPREVCLIILPNCQSREDTRHGRD